MRVGFSLRVIENTTYPETRDAISHDWTQFFSKWNLFPIAIPNGLRNLPTFLKEMNVSAFLLTNGNNVGPLDNEKSPELTDVSLERDNTENQIIKYAIENSIPLLGICRGLQMINIYFEGTLVRDLTTICGASTEHVNNTHKIEFIDQEWKNYLSLSSVFINSYHNQGVTLSTLSPELRPFALANNDIVEGLYHPEHPVYGIQWHPERNNPATAIDQKIINRWLNKRLKFRVN